MEKVPESNTKSLIDHLKTPLGLATVVGISAGIGLLVGLLHKKFTKKDKNLQNGQNNKESKNMFKMIKNTIKLENKYNSYSDELILMVYEFIAISAQDEFNELMNETEKQRISLVNDPKAYLQSLQDFEKSVTETVKNQLGKVVEEAGGVADLFLDVQAERQTVSQAIAHDYQKLIMKLRSKYERLRAEQQRKVTPELVREICEYQKELFEELETKSLLRVFGAKVIALLWVRDQVNQKFGVDITSRTYLKVAKELNNSDPGFREPSVVFANK